MLNESMIMACIELDERQRACGYHALALCLHECRPCRVSNRLGTHGDFFKLGGHSLTAIALTERLRKQSLSSETRVVFNKPTGRTVGRHKRKQGQCFDILFKLILDCFEQSLTSTFYKEFRL